MVKSRSHSVTKIAHMVESQDCCVSALACVDVSMQTQVMFTTSTGRAGWLDRQRPAVQHTLETLAGVALAVGAWCVYLAAVALCG